MATTWSARASASPISPPPRSSTRWRSPEEGPLTADSPSAKGFDAFRTPLEDRRGIEWVKEMFRRHRKPAKMAATAA